MLRVLTITELTSLRAYLKPRVIDPDLCDGTLKYTHKWLKARKPLYEEGVIKQSEQAMAVLLAFYADNPDASQAEAGAVAARSRQWVSSKLAELTEAGLSPEERAVKEQPPAFETV